MSTLVVNRKKFDDEAGELSLPGNDFNIKEGNTRIFIKPVLQDHPDTRPFSSELTVSVNDPDSSQITFDFGTIDLDATQESLALAVIIAFRDKNSFTQLDQLSIDRQEQINEVFEQVDDSFDEDNIGDIELIDICAIRDEFKSIYNASPWDSFSVGEKRILISDWVIPTDAERKSIFQGPAKRSDIYKLFGNRMANFMFVQAFNDISLLPEQFETDDFDLFFKRLFAPGKVNLTNEVFISRSNFNSDDANADEVSVPVFSNVRNTASFVDATTDLLGTIIKDVQVDIEYSATVQANNNKNYQVKVLLNGNDIDGQGMKRDGRGRNTVTHSPIRINLNENDTIEVKLLPLNTNNGAVVAQSGKSMIRISEVLK